MTIGEKILHLRSKKSMSQEELAEVMGVSRQSVSKWEMDQALPQLDKVMLLCKLFDITADELLQDKINLSPAKNEKRKYFGTDGFRGEANGELTSMHAYKVGRFLGWYYASKLSGCEKIGYRPKIVIGKDTRRSSYMLEYSIASGITASGADAYMLHVTTTPSVSYVARGDEFDCGIMITASHNPFYDNGIKVINGYGEKLDDSVVALIESYLDGDVKALGIDGEDIPSAKGEKIGCIVDYVSGRNRYVGYLISLASHSYKNLKIGLDCANGASWMIAKSVFGALGAQVVLIGAEPDGVNINRDCGSTHIEKLRKTVLERHLDVGFAFDGDCDRCIAIDENGSITDGDKILYILANRLKSRGMLSANKVAVTVMSNSGFVKSMEKCGIECVETAVGDRYVYECMQEKDLSLGGEQSGHIIIKKYATTGDGLLTAIMLCEEICDSKMQFSKLSEDVHLYPQYMKNVRVYDKNTVMEDEDIQFVIKETEKKINGNGKVLVRVSGTEPLIRVMVECEEEILCEKYVDAIVNTIKSKGYANE